MQRTGDDPKLVDDAPATMFRDGSKTFHASKTMFHARPKTFHAWTTMFHAWSKTFHAWKTLGWDRFVFDFGPF